MNKQSKVCIILFIIFLYSTHIFTEEKKLYFPNNNKQCEILNSFFSFELDVLDPENIQEAEKDVIRILNSESFKESYVLKVDLSKHNSSIHFIVGNDKKNGETSKIKYSTKKNLSEYNVLQILEFVEKSEIYNQPSFHNSSGRDGNELIIELNIAGNYKLIDRWNPKEGPEYELWNYLLELLNSK